MVFCHSEQGQRQVQAQAVDKKTKYLKIPGLPPTLATYVLNGKAFALFISSRPELCSESDAYSTPEWCGSGIELKSLYPLPPNAPRCALS